MSGSLKNEGLVLHSNAEHRNLGTRHSLGQSHAVTPGPDILAGQAERAEHGEDYGDSAADCLFIVRQKEIKNCPLSEFLPVL
jgi:hypothetical protein